MRFHVKQQLKRRLAAALLLASGVLFAGCVAVENSYEVNADGSGTQTVRLTLPAEVATSFGEEMPDIEAMQDDPELEQLREALGEDGSITFFSSEQAGIGFTRVTPDRKNGV